MALPANDAQWPPQNVQKSYEQYAIYDAWMTGDVSKLEIIYTNIGASNSTGLWGGIRRFFWGSPNPSQVSQPPVKLHAPIAGEVARMSSNLLFGEMFDAKFENDEDNDDKAPGGGWKPQASYDKANARVSELLDDNAHARFLELGQYQAAHGGCFMKVAWDKSVNPYGPFLVVCPSDTAVPEFSYGQLSAVTFWSALAPIGQQAYILLERHDPGTIEYGLYESSSKGMLGNRVDLSVHPDVSSLIGVVNENSQVETGSPLLTARYFPNLKPNGKLRKDPLGRNLGKSDYDGAEDLMDALDETFTSLMRDFRLGKTRIMVPKGFLNTLGPGLGAQFNNDQEIFTELGEQVGSLNPAANGGSAQSFITTFQPVIRYEEHEQILTHLKDEIYAACGYSSQTFGESGDVAVTATEVTAREKLTILTRAAKILVTRPELVLLLAALLDVDEFMFDGPGRNGIFPNIEFPDAASENPQVVAQTLQLLNTAESASVETRVRMLHPDWDDEQVDNEVTKIRDDFSMLPDPSMSHLWAAESLNGSATGGVQATQSGAQIDPAQAAAVQKADNALVSSEDKLDGNESGN